MYEAPASPPGPRRVGDGTLPPSPSRHQLRRDVIVVVDVIHGRRVAAAGKPLPEHPGATVLSGARMVDRPAIRQRWEPVEPHRHRLTTALSSAVDNAAGLGGWNCSTP